LASSRSSSNGADWRDVAGNLVAFEAMNGCRLEIRLSTADWKGRADIRATVVAHSRKVEIGDQPSLGSVSVTCSDTRLKSLEGLLIHALYMLDAQLANVEMWGENEAVDRSAAP
jgi:hypothetical protein